MPSRKDDNPLFLHKNGQWCKKVKGNFHYFGKDKDKALAKWCDEKDCILAGRKPPRSSGAAKLDELVNLYLDYRERLVQAGEIVDRSFQDDVQTLRRVVSIMGKTSCPSVWEPFDFAQLKGDLANPIRRTTPLKGGVVIGKQVSKRSPNTVAGDIRRIKAFLNYLTDEGHIDPPKYGREFRQPSDKAKKRVQSSAGRRDVQSEDFLKIVESATRGFRPLLWLGLNCAFGNRDIATMRIDQLPDLNSDTVWLEIPRGKTGVERRSPLWPETVEAIREYQEHRPTARKGHSGLLFLTKYGLPWLREAGTDRKDGVSAAFKTYSTNAGVVGHAFYDLRRTFLTRAEESLDFPAVQSLMGHKPKSNDMSGVYRQHISDERLLAVSNHVRNWLLGAK